MQQLHIASIQLFTQLDENVTLSTVNVLKEYGKIIFLNFYFSSTLPWKPKIIFLVKKMFTP